MNKRWVGAKDAIQENSGGTWEYIAGSSTDSSLLFPSAASVSFVRAWFGDRGFIQPD